MSLTRLRCTCVRGRAFNEDPATDLFYCDEDNFHETLSDRYSPIFKPDFNIDLLYSQLR